MLKLELLAPAGNWDSFVAAVENGADAVYLGAKGFNARQNASNFDHDELGKAISYAHIRGVKLYLTLNTLVSDSEISDALALALDAYQSGIDAVIVQDIGLANLLRQQLPDLHIHGSTQMTISDIHGAATLSQWGFRRVVLARELTLEEIAAIAQSKIASIEVEVFVHGALCICYSGQCLFSSVIGERSGNRGKCAQPCRMKYTLYDNKKTKQAEGYLLSPKDMCAIAHLPELEKIGVTSIKIEGRMKTPEYVATVVRIYREVLDTGQFSPQNQQDLLQIFNRGGFTSGYFKGKPGTQLLSLEKPKNWGILLGYVTAWNPHRHLVQLQLQEDIQQGDGLEIWNGEDESPGTIVTEIRDSCGQLLSSAKAGQQVWVGRIQGRLHVNDKVFRTSSKDLCEKARQSFAYNKMLRKVPLDGEWSWNNSDGATLTVRDDQGHQIQIQEPPSSSCQPLSIQRILEQLNKTGDTPFQWRKLIIQDENVSCCSLAIRAVNHLRRRVLSAMAELRGQVVRRSTKFSPAESTVSPATSASSPITITSTCTATILHPPHLSLFFYRSDIHPILPQCQNVRIYIPINILQQIQKICDTEQQKKQQIEFVGWIPPIVRGQYRECIRSYLTDMVSSPIAACMVGNLGMIHWLRTEFASIRCFADCSCNIFNTKTIQVLAKLGIYGVTLSPEMTLAQIQEMHCSLIHLPSFCIQQEALVYGRIPIMMSEVCPSAMMSRSSKPSKAATSSIAAALSRSYCHTCTGCSHQHKCLSQSLSENDSSWTLEDRMQFQFPLLWNAQTSQSTILNSKILFAPHVMAPLQQAGIHSFRMIFFDESNEQIISLIKSYQQVLQSPTILKPPEPTSQYTQGHYFRSV